MFARALAPLALALSASATLVTVFNNCPHQVDPAFYPAVRVGRNTTGGFALQAFYETVVVLPDGWSGRMWGRTNCTARGVCATGQCFTGGENCTSPAPAGPTLAQFTLNGYASLDFYNPSTADGFNIPLQIDVDADGDTSCRTPMAECTGRGAGAGCGQTSTCPTGTAYTVRFC